MCRGLCNLCFATVCGVRWVGQLSRWAKLVDLKLAFSRKLMLPRGFVRARFRASSSDRLSSFTMPFGSTCTGNMDVKLLAPATEEQIRKGCVVTL